MAYVDGFVIPVPKAKLDAYRALAQQTGALWREHGALQFRECVADDVKPGQRTSFPQAVDLKEDETVVFSYIVYESRAHRDQVNSKVMADPRCKELMAPETLPFDGKRMIFGGFDVMLDA
jgi:uncharacterized protein YbaA (DUF1428 family)